MTRTLALLMLALALTACAGPTRWHKAGADKEQVAADLKACRGLATRQADREFDRRAIAQDSLDLRRDSSPGAQMAQFEFKKRRDRLTSACMRGRGYGKKKGGSR